MSVTIGAFFAPKRDVPASRAREMSDKRFMGEVFKRGDQDERHKDESDITFACMNGIKTGLLFNMGATLVFLLSSFCFMSLVFPSLTVLCG